MADELDDDFIQSDVDSDQELEVEDTKTQSNSSKRKAVNGEDEGDDILSSSTKRKSSSNKGNNEEEERRNRKKQKMKKRDEIKKQKKANANLALDKGALAKFPIEMQTDHLRLLMKSCKEFSKLSELELDQIGIQQSMLIDVSGSKRENETTNSKNDDQLISLIEKAIPKIRSNVDDQIREGAKGQPLILVITGNAQRAADLSRPLRSFNPSSSSSDKESKSKPKKKIAVAKLFARHFKIEEQKDFLQTHICPLAVGTPQRIQDLLLNGALRLNKLSCIIFDVSWTDQKQRTMLDTIETRQALFSMLTSDQFQTRLRDSKSSKKDGGRARIMLY